MAEYDKDKQAKEYYTHVPVEKHGFFLKGAHSLDWGMKNRLSRIFRPDTGRTVMFAIDHGYFPELCQVSAEIQNSRSC